MNISHSAIVFEGEKSTLLYQSMFGREQDISVAMCGSNLSDFQVKLLLDEGVRNLVVAFDRQFQEIGDEEFVKLKKNLLKIKQNFSKDVLVSFIFDKNMITDYKASPLDHGAETFLKLYKERIII